MQRKELYIHAYIEEWKAVINHEMILFTVLKVFHLQVISTNIKDLNLPETYYNSLFYFF